MDPTEAQLNYHQQSVASALDEANTTNFDDVYSSDSTVTTTAAYLLAVTTGKFAQHLLPTAIDESAATTTTSTVAADTTSSQFSQLPSSSSAVVAVLTTILVSSNDNRSDPATTTAFDGTARFDDEEPSFTPLQAIAVCIILSIVIIGTIVGNVLVCVAVCIVRKLRRPCNYLLVSLAVSDLCVAVLVMPTALLYEVLGTWNFGTVFCDIWVSFDVLSCTASILNLCAISVDRFWAITKPLEYGVKRTPRRMMLNVALVWLGAACISLPPLLIIGNEHEGADGVPICVVCQSVGYQIYATLGSFYIPLSVMLFVYYQIFKAARRIVMDEKRAQTRLEKAINGMTAPPVIKTDTVGETANTPAHSEIGATSPHHKKLRFQLAKERKASTTLGIIMTAFTVCWLPFFILALVRPFLSHSHSTLASLFLWLGYANSLLNPIIYATLNRDFRKPFQEILYFRCSNLNLMMREDFYHSQYGEPASQRVLVGGDSQKNQGARESFL